ncbi:hypothetical protein [Arthrobacter globiformis]|uniref:hypothetical protein n=1 Tax=Arthrobacter globiformis TaxID=1665 RepID=UPI00278F6DE9|nr:hypothetical protein [Arthrobacter globiformis]MDQ0618095.1 hypothetical protein [Arthrobacter globiformis]
MARNRNFSRREKRKAPATVPAVPDLGRLTMPRWYSVVSAVILFLAGVAFAARAVLTLRSSS